MLAQEHTRDPYKDRFDYRNQIAIRYRLAGDQSREVEALRAAHSAASGDLLANNFDWVDRYLSLLYSTGQRVELQRLASGYSPHQLQLINFLIEKNERDLALSAIARARQSAAWMASRSGEVGLFLKDRSAETAEFFITALERRPIGEALQRRIDPTKILLGDDWFIGARNYGYWLGMVGREVDSRRLVVADIERHPSAVAAQLELAAYYLDRKDVVRAVEHVTLATELGPEDVQTAIMRGSVALARGDRQAAREAWAILVSSKTPSPSNAIQYAKVMADNDFFLESLPKLEQFLVDYIALAATSQNESRMDAIKPLVREVAERARRDTGHTNEGAAFFQRVVTRTPDDLSIGRMLIEESLLPESTLSAIYRLTHQRLSDRAAAVAGTARYENGYWSGTEFVYPARELAEWRRRLLDFLIRNDSIDEARLLIGHIKQEQTDLRTASEESAVGDHYDWLPLASALIDLRDGRSSTRAVSELRRYCGLDAVGPGDQSDPRGGSAGVNERCLNAHALLVSERREPEADALLYDAYRAAVASRNASEAALAGLAEIEARRGRNESASRLLKIVVERSTTSLQPLKSAAEAAARIGLYSIAAAFREQIATANPQDSTNRLELARVIAAAGQADDAFQRLVVLIGERTTGNSVRAQAAEAIGMIVARDTSLAPRARRLVEQGSGSRADGLALARAAISEAIGQRDDATATLATITGPLAAIAQLKLGLVAISHGRDSVAITHLERATNLDSDGVLTDSIAFRTSGIRTQLIALYSRVGRHTAAIRMAESEMAVRRTAAGDALRAALTSGSVRTEAVSISRVVFEPAPEPLRSAETSFKTLDEMSQVAASAAQQILLSSLSVSAASLGLYDRAIALERLRASVAKRPEEKASIEKRLEELTAVERDRQIRVASQLQMTRSNTTTSVYAARVLGAN